MTLPHNRNALAVAMILVYSLLVMVWSVAQGPLAPGEAQTVFLGRDIIAGGLGAGSSPALNGVINSRLGSVAVAPVAVAAADAIAGIYGARLLSVMLCLLLVFLVYRIGDALMYGKRGLLAASVFVFLGVPLQLSSSATADAYVAVLLCGALWCVARTAGAGSPRERGFMLLLAAALLALAAMTDYLAALFVVPFVLLVFARHRFSAAAAFFLLPLLVLFLLYGYFAILPAWPVLSKELSFSLPPVDASHDSPFMYIFNWLVMPLLLTGLGMFHKEGRGNILLTLLLAAPAFLIPYVTSDVGGMHTGVFLAMIFLAPAAALGVVQMVELFSLHNDMTLVKPFFVTAILIIIWVFGIQQIRELKHERPDLSPAVAFLYQKGSLLSTVLVDSDYGSPEYVYRYHLEAKSPPARVVSITRGDEKERRDIVALVRPEFVVVDSFHSIRSYDRACREYLAQGFTVAATYQMSLALGVKNVRIFQRGGL